MNKRRLAVLYEPQSVDPLRLAISAAGRWDLLWILDRTIPGAGENLALLQRFGLPVDVTGAGIAEAATAVGTCDPSGIVAYSDEQLMSAALIAQHIGLAHNSPEVVCNLTDKHTQRRALQSAGLSVPGYWIISSNASPKALTELVAEIQFPVILKPRFGSGSRNTARLDDAAALSLELAEAGRHGADELVIEQYLSDGVPRGDQVFADYVSVETAVAGGQLRHIVVTGCFPLAEPFRESGNFVPSALTSEQAAGVEQLAAAAIVALGVTSGLLHTEIKLTPAGPRVIEVNGRIGGDVPDLVRLASGRDMFEISALIALDGQLPKDVPVRCGQVGYILNVQPPQNATSVTSVEGLPQVAKFAGVEAVKLNRRPGDRLDWRDGTAGYIYSVLGSAADHDAMLRSRSQVFEKMVVSYES